MSEKSGFEISADDMVGILIHNANQIASVLTQMGVTTDFVKLRNHLVRMDDIAARCHAYQQAIIAAHSPQAETEPDAERPN